MPAAESVTLRFVPTSVRLKGAALRSAPPSARLRLSRCGAWVPGIAYAAPAREKIAPPNVCAAAAARGGVNAVGVMI